MKFTNTLRLLAVSALSFSIFAGCKPDEGLAAPPQKTSREVIDGLRLRQLTRNLQLTKEQQEQIKPLLEAEGKQIIAVREDATLSIEQRSDRYKQFRDEAYGKIAMLLTPDQSEQLGQIRAQTEGKKVKK